MEVHIYKLGIHVHANYHHASTRFCRIFADYRTLWHSNEKVSRSVTVTFQYWKFCIALMFCIPKFSQILQTWNCLQKDFSEDYGTLKLSHNNNIKNGSTVSFSTSLSKADWNYPGTILVNTQGAFLKKVFSSLIFKANTKTEAVLKSSTAGWRWPGERTSRSVLRRRSR